MDLQGVKTTDPVANWAWTMDHQDGKTTDPVVNWAWTMDDGRWENDRSLAKSQNFEIVPSSLINNRLLHVLWKPHSQCVHGEQHGPVLQYSSQYRSRRSGTRILHWTIDWTQPYTTDSTWASIYRNTDRRSGGLGTDSLLTKFILPHSDSIRRGFCADIDRSCTWRPGKCTCTSHIAMLYQDRYDTRISVDHL
jgi:hypothetical protein